MIPRDPVCLVKDFSSLFTHCSSKITTIPEPPTGSVLDVDFAVSVAV